MGMLPWVSRMIKGKGEMLSCISRMIKGKLQCCYVLLVKLKIYVAMSNLYNKKEGWMVPYLTCRIKRKAKYHEYLE